MTPEEFITAIAPAAQASMHATQIPASFVIADGALESAWGSSMLAQQGMNLFGVKADPSWHGPIIEMRTREFTEGHWEIVPAQWRKYSSWLECLNDHAQFLLTNPRYEDAFSYTGNPETFARAVAAAGYATDPAYAGKIISIMRQHNLTTFDKEAS